MKTIALKDDTYAELAALKSTLSFKSFDDVVRLLLSCRRGEKNLYDAPALSHTPKRYVQNLKVSPEARRWLERVMSFNVYRYVPLRDVIRAAWPKCPKCSGPLVQKYASKNVICADCRTEYALSVSTYFTNPPASNGADQI